MRVYIKSENNSIRQAKRDETPDGYIDMSIEEIEAKGGFREVSKYICIPTPENVERFLKEFTAYNDTPDYLKPYAKNIVNRDRYKVIINDDGMIILDTEAILKCDFR